LNHELHLALEDIVYAWSIQGRGIDRLVDEIHDYVIETYGPPF
jgi:hypothetical protein